MTIKIEKLNRNHTDGLVKLENQCFSEPWSEKALSELADCEYAVYFVAVADNEVVGYGGMYVSADMGAINNIGVLEDFRRQGIASALLEALIDYSRSNGILLLTLEVRKSNLSAIALYEKYGFKLVFERKNYYKKPTENALLYNLELS